MKLIGILSGISVLTPTQSHEADRYFEWYLSTNSNTKCAFKVSVIWDSYILFSLTNN